MDPIKMVVRFADGKMKKGYSQDFFANKPVFHLIKNITGDSGEPEEIRLADLKAVFFVKTFDGDPDYKERKDFTETDSPQGRKVEVAFTDGEVLQGSVLGYNPKEIGFFLFPVDPRSNNLRVFVVNTAVKKIRFLESDSTPTTPSKSDYQCLLPDTWGKLLMLSEEERKLLRLVLSRVMETNSGREYIVEKLGKPYLQVAKDLLGEMEKG
jgi:hypothetical protein